MSEGTDRRRGIIRYLVQIVVFAGTLFYVTNFNRQLGFATTIIIAAAAGIITYGMVRYLHDRQRLGLLIVVLGASVIVAAFMGWLNPAF